MNNSWEDKNETKIGNLGEAIVVKGLEKVGLIVYTTSTNKSHPLDIICVNDKNEDEIMFFEVKTKPHRYCCGDTGVDLHSWNRYLNLIDNYKCRMYLFFVDEYEGYIYHLNINLTIKNNKYRIKYNEGADNGIVYFSLDDMKLSKKLSIEEVEMFDNLRNELKHPIKDINKYSGYKYFSKT